VTRTAQKIELTNTDRQTLLKWVKSPNTPQKLVHRADIILAIVGGQKDKDISQRIPVSLQTICFWRKRFFLEGLAGLQDRNRPGRPRTINEKKRAEIVAATLTVPFTGDLGQWSTRSLAELQGVGHSSVHRIWTAHHLKPLRVEGGTSRKGRTPSGRDKTLDIIGLYLNPPEQALVVGVKNPQVRKPKRASTAFPLIQSQVNKTKNTSLIEALEYAGNHSIEKSRYRPGQNEFLRFLKQLDGGVQGQDLHIIMGTYGTHELLRVQNWIKRHRQVQLHLTPPGASWLRMVQIWYDILSQRESGQGQPLIPVHPVEAIKTFYMNWENSRRPFSWVKTNCLLPKVG
jgi:transposase